MSGATNHTSYSTTKEHRYITLGSNSTKRNIVRRLVKDLMYKQHNGIKIRCIGKKEVKNGTSSL